MASLRSMVLLLVSCLLWTIGQSLETPETSALTLERPETSALTLETPETSALTLERPETGADLTPVAAVEEAAGGSLAALERVVREAGKISGNENKMDKTKKQEGKLSKSDKKNRKAKKLEMKKKKSTNIKNKDNEGGKGQGKKKRGNQSQRKTKNKKRTQPKNNKGAKTNNNRRTKTNKNGNKIKSTDGKQKRKNKDKKNKWKLKKLNKRRKSKADPATKTWVPESRASTVNLTCLTNTVRLLKFMKDNVANFLTRYSRQNTQNNLTTRKGDKKGEFAEPAARLVQAGGGNKSNLSCGGSTTSTGALQLLNLTSRLDNCSAALQAVCVPPSGINQTFMTECYTKSKGFNDTLTSCLTTALKGEDACSCFENATLVGAMTDLKNCSGTAEAKLAAATRTLCLAQIQSCNADIDSAGKLQYTCQFTVAEMKQTLAQISNNNATVQKMIASVTNLTGVSVAKPNRTAGLRSVREAQENAYTEMRDTVGRHSGQTARVKRAATTCDSITTIVKACTSAISDAPASKKVVMLCNIPSNATKVTCTRGLAELQAAATSLDSAQRIFTAFTISLQEELGASSGTTVSTAALATLVSSLGGGGGGATAAASGRNRNMLRRMVLDKLKK